MLTIRAVHLDCSCSSLVVVCFCFYCIVTISSTYSFRRMIAQFPLYIVQYICLYVMYVKCYGVSRAKIDMNEILRLDAYINTTQDPLTPIVFPILSVLPCLSIFSSHQSGHWSHGISSLCVEARPLAARAGVALAGAVATTVAGVVPLLLLLSLLPLVARQHVLVLTLRAGTLLQLAEMLPLLPSMC